jgi:hypothetical protein
LVETKRLLKQVNATAVPERMNQEAVLFGRLLSEPAAQQAFAAFMSKRS